MLVGQLVDDRELGLKFQPIQLHLPNSSKHKTLLTDKHGSFRLTTTGWPTKGTYLMIFPGDLRHASSQCKRQLDLGRVDLVMKARFPTVLATGTKAFSIEVHLQYQGHAQDNLPVTLLMHTKQTRSFNPSVPMLSPDPVSRDVSRTHHQPLMTLYTQHRGKVRFVWQGAPLQGPAQIPIAVSFPGNSYFLPQQIQNFLVISPEEQGSNTYLWWGLGLLGMALFLGWTGLHKIRSWLVKRLHPVSAPSWPESLPPLDTGSISWIPDSEIPFSPEDDLSLVGVILAVGTQKPLANISVEVSPCHSDDMMDSMKNHTQPVQPVQPVSPLYKTVTDSRGYFLISLGSPGTVRVSFSHPHVQAKQMELTLPHRSHNRILRVTLASYRHLVYETFVAVARSSWCQKPFDPKSQTVREWLRSLPHEQSEALEPLAHAFEKAYYGSLDPTAQDYETLSTFFQTRIQKQR